VGGRPDLPVTVMKLYHVMTDSNPIFLSMRNLSLAKRRLGAHEVSGGCLFGER
jgi:hypothetical protein